MATWKAYALATSKGGRQPSGVSSGRNDMIVLLEPNRYVKIGEIELRYALYIYIYIYIGARARGERAQMHM